MSLKEKVVPIGRAFARCAKRGARFPSRQTRFDWVALSSNGGRTNACRDLATVRRREDEAAFAEELRERECRGERLVGADRLAA